MRKSGIISITAFLISLIVYASWFFNEDLFSNSAMIIAGVLPIIGIITALLTKITSLKVAGLVGNSFVLLWAVVIPIVSTLFWNTP
ncbi:hypothetical protein ACTSEZ_07630 [Metabacillus sp. JX24]|uniref:hypothetical protein n=1 Tax=Metabacillus sp. JX24 TaxID=3240759 RepID=UPI00350FAD90